MLAADLLIILKTYLVSLGMQILVWPVAKKWLGKMPDSGWALGRAIVSFLPAVVVWQLGYLGLPSNNSQSLVALLSVLGLVSLWLIYNEGWGLLKTRKKTLKIIAIEEYLFLVGLVLMAVIRGHSPELNSLEKFMDFGFVKQYLVTNSLPVPDMWQAGETINYYSFGHFWASTMIRFWGVEPAVGYNLMLAFIFAMTMGLVFVLVLCLINKNDSRAAAVGGVIGSMLVLVAGNSQALWYWLKNGSLQDYWYADATRFIHNTIHEFPSYSFVVSDLHGHLLDLPIVLVFMILVTMWLKEKRLLYEVSMGVLCGVMVMANTWDVAVYGLLLVVLGGQLLLTDKNNLRPLLRLALVVAVTTAVTAAPWAIGFEMISNGVGVVSERSPWWQILVLWGGGAVVALWGLFLSKGEEKGVVVRSLVLTAFLLLAIPEFIFARDIYPNHPRANTMFKLTYQAFIMMGVVGGFAWGKVLDRSKEILVAGRLAGLFCLGAITAGMMIFPVKAFSSYYGSFAEYRGLDGEAWIATTKPEYAGMVEYLKKNRDGKNLAEAVGDSYSLLNLVSVFSGTPSIQGWRVHEWLWRGGYDIVAKRQAEVEEIYQGISREETGRIIQKYRLGWIVVGPDERLLYRVNEEKLWTLGKIVWQDGESYLLEITESSPADW